MVAPNSLYASRPSRSPANAILPGPTRGLRIGLMGGSFDPAHSGHRHLAETARTRLGLDWVWVIPAAGNPLKRTQTPFDQRMTSARLVMFGPRTRFSAIEPALRLTYTIDLVRALQRRAPQARFVWIMGADGLSDLHLWKDWRALARLIPIVVVSRPGASPKAGLSRFSRLYGQARMGAHEAHRLAERSPPAWTYLSAPFDPASSTEIRRARAMLPALPI